MARSDDGHVVFATRRPERRGWEEWTQEPPVVRYVPGEGVVPQTLELTRVALPLVSFRHTYWFASDGVTLTSESTLRFRTVEEIERSLYEEGFTVLDVRDAPDRPGRENVFVARRTAAPPRVVDTGGRRCPKR